MASAGDRDPEVEVDRLYQLPLDQFVQSRNELARRVGRAERSAIRGLPKPNVLAWALNQLYWSKRATFERLVATAVRLRSEQAEALLGKRVDLRAAGEAHREAIRAALAEATAVLETAGHAATPDSIRELTGALEALPWKDGPGRLVRPPVASGFNALAGLPVVERSDANHEVRATPERACRPGGETAVGRGSPRPPEAGDLPGVRDKAYHAAMKAAHAAVEAARREEARAEEERGAAASTLDAARRAAAEAARRLQALETS